MAQHLVQRLPRRLEERLLAGGARQAGGVVDAPARPQNLLVAGPRHAQRVLLLARARKDQMGVGVHKAGQHRAAARVQHARLRADLDRLPHRRARADRRDLLAPHCHRAVAHDAKLLQGGPAARRVALPRQRDKLADILDQERGGRVGVHGSVSTSCSCCCWRCWRCWRFALRGGRAAGAALAQRVAHVAEADRAEHLEQALDRIVQHQDHGDQQPRHRRDQRDQQVVDPLVPAAGDVLRVLQGDAEQQQEQHAPRQRDGGEQADPLDALVKHRVKVAVRLVRQAEQGQHQGQDGAGGGDDGAARRANGGDRRAQHLLRLHPLQHAPHQKLPAERHPRREQPAEDRPLFAHKKRVLPLALLLLLRFALGFLGCHGWFLAL